MFGTGGGALAADSTLEQIKKSGTFRVGVTPTLPPGAMRGKDGNLIGFEIDVATQIAKDMSVKVEFVPTVWDGLIPGLLGSQFDAIISVMSMTPARNLTVNFSDSYSGTGMYLTAHKTQAKDLSTVKQFNDPKITLAVMRGSTTATVAQRLMPNARIRQFDDQALMVQEVVNGNAHAFLASAPRPQNEVRANPEKLFIPVPEPLVESAEGIAVRKGDPDFLNFLNNWIFLRKRDGWMKERHDYWFESRAWADQVAQ
jgi:polar amino acid transport system substrate-binding protein